MIEFTQSGTWAIVCRGKKRSVGFSTFLKGSLTILSRAGGSLKRLAAGIGPLIRPTNIVVILSCYHELTPINAPPNFRFLTLSFFLSFEKIQNLNKFKFQKKFKTQPNI
jgi:hypothetical protein